MASKEYKLLECSWRGISFPIADLSTALSQDIVQHKYPDRDGAHIESTGLNPITISAKAVFYNNISPSVNETWKYSKLFPETYNEFIDACKDRTVGTLQHPFLGSLQCKLVSANTTLVADRRDGVEVAVEWIETIEVELSDVKQTTTSDINNAADVDNAFNSISNSRNKALLYGNTKTLNGMSYFQAVNQVKGLIDSGTLVGLKALAQLNRITHSLDGVLDSINRIDSVLYADLKSKTNSLKFGLNNTKKQLNKTLGIISPYFTDKEMTMGEIAQEVNNGIVDLLRLNPQFAIKPIIPRGSEVKYYKVG